MSLSGLSVRRPVTGVMVFLCLSLAGLYSFSQLKLDMLPNIEFPIVAVITQYPGAGPEAIEDLVTRPVEAALSSLDHVEEITSTSSQGSSLVMVKFAWGTDMASAEQELRKNLELFTYDRLPEGIERSLTFAFDPSLQPIMFLTVNAPGSSQAVRTLAEEEIGPALTRISGVAAAEVMGGAKREIQVRVRPEWLQVYGLPVGQVVAALRGANVIVPGGTLDQGALELGIVTDALFPDVEAIRRTVVGVRGGVPVLLRDVADVVDGFEEVTHVVRADGKSAVMMAVRKQSDANTVQVVRRLYAALEKLEQRLPDEATVTPIFDQAEPITRSISNLSTTALAALFFTAVVLLVFLRNWRSASIALVSIPLSVLATFMVMAAFDVTLNIISMAGLALAVGMLVDNSIVVLENIFAHQQAGEGPKAAAIAGTVEVAMPITASTLTTVAVFAPVLFVPGLAGQLFRDMALTICISLASSLGVTLTLVPLLASLLTRKGKKALFEDTLRGLTRWLDPLSERYGRFLRRALHHRWKVLGVALLIFGGSLGLATRLGVDFMAQADQAMIILEVEAAPGTSVQATDRLFEEAEKIVGVVVPEARVVASEFGSGEGFAALLGQTSSKGILRVRLPPRSQRARSQFEIEAELREKLGAIAGLEVRPFDQGLGAFGGGGDIAVKVFADDLDQLRDYGTRLADRLKKVEGAVDVKFSLEAGKPELQVELDRDQIRLLGLTPARVASTINTYFMGTPATMYRESGDEHRVLVRAPRAVRQNVARLRTLPVMTPRGGSVPLSTVARITESLGPVSVTRENQRRLGKITLRADAIPLGTLMERVDAAIDDLPAEPGVSLAIGGTAEDLVDSFKALGLAILIAILLVYMVMASQFESLLEPFVILFAVPLSGAGVIFAMWITDTTVQTTVLIGVVLLSGVVVNNGIVLLDVLKNRRLAGDDLIDAAVLAGQMRLRPILMTTLTTVLGMMPLSLGTGDGGEIWAPMARAVIGGLSLSALLTLVVVPAGYVIIAGWVDRRRARKAPRVSALAGFVLLLLALPSASARAEVLTLDAALVAARAHNPDLAAMQARVDIARTAVRKAWAGYLPKVSLGGAFTHNSTEAVLPFPDFAAGFDIVTDPQGNLQMLPRKIDRIEVQRQNQVGAQLDVQQPIFAAPLIPLIGNARAGARLAELGAKQATQEILFATVQAYLAAVGLKEAIVLGEHQLQLLGKHERSAQAALEVEMASRLSVLRAKIEVGRAEQELARTRAAYAAARGGLATLIARETIDFEVVRPQIFEADGDALGAGGLPGAAGSETAGAGGTGEADAGLEAEVEALLRRSAGLRPEIESARLTEEIGERGKQAVWAKFLPTIAASWTYRYSDVKGFTNENGNWALMLVASVPIYDGGLRYAELKEADARIREARARARGTRLQVRRELRQARLDIDSARANLAKVHEQVTLARANWQAVEEGFAAGASSAIEVSDAAAALRGAELQRLSEEIALTLARVSLRKAVGLPLLPEGT